jgi:hypothetical protein
MTSEARRFEALCEHAEEKQGGDGGPIPMVMVSDDIFDDVLAKLRRKCPAFTGRNDGTNNRWIMKPDNFGFPSCFVDGVTKSLIPRRVYSGNTSVVPMNRFHQEEERLRMSFHQYGGWLYSSDGQTPIGKWFQSVDGVRVPLYFEDRHSSIDKAADTCAYPACNSIAKKLCSRCFGVRYCSVDHQRRDWAFHKNVCAHLIAKVNNDD